MGATQAQNKVTNNTLQNQSKQVIQKNRSSAQLTNTVQSQTRSASCQLKQTQIQQQYQLQQQQLQQQQQVIYYNPIAYYQQQQNCDYKQMGQNQMRQQDIQNQKSCQKLSIKKVIPVIEQEKTQEKQEITPFQQIEFNNKIYLNDSDKKVEKMSKRASTIERIEKSKFEFPIDSVQTTKKYIIKNKDLVPCSPYVFKVSKENQQGQVFSPDYQLELQKPMKYLKNRPKRNQFKFDKN